MRLAATSGRALVMALTKRAALASALWFPLIFTGAAATGCEPESPQASATGASVVGCDMVFKPDGDDANDCLSDATACRTLESKQTMFTPGMTICLSATGLHGPQALRAVSGTPLMPIIVKPYGGDVATIDGGAAGDLAQFQTAPNALWEPVPGGHPDEYRSTVVLFRGRNDPILWGQILGTEERLLSYARLEDLRADNESFARVPIDDPRPGGQIYEGALTDEKLLWTYFGPGLTWVLEDPDDVTQGGRIHIRLSPTNLGAPGITDYQGDGGMAADPNELALSFASELQIAFDIGDVDYVEFHDLVVQNGGENTLKIDGSADSAVGLVFDGVRVYGGKFSVLMTHTTDLVFKDSVFDGRLADWTARTEVKDGYTFLRPETCDNAGNGCSNDERGNPDTCIVNSCYRGNGLAGRTNDMLVVMGSSHLNTEFVNCEFRNAHDGMSVSGIDTRVHKSLFEDLNDEGIQLKGELSGTTDNVWISENMIRQVLNPLSFSTNTHTDTRVFIYRNVIDTRMPTRGYRRLPPDVPAPFIWRHGADFKINENVPGGGIPQAYVYQNTFVTTLQGVQTVSAFFTAVLAGVDRQFVNNVHVAVDTDLPYTWIPDPCPNAESARSQGNLYYNYTPGVSRPLFRYLSWSPPPVPPAATCGAGNPGGVFYDMAELDGSDIDLAYDGELEQGSRNEDPQIAGFTPEIFPHQQPYPTHGYGLTSPTPGVALDPSWPDIGAPPVPPNHIGAIPFTSASVYQLEVGVEGAIKFPASVGLPVAVAGGSRTIADADDDGFEVVTLDASASYDPQGPGVVSYQWTVDGASSPASSDPELSVWLPIGRHYVQLRVSNGLYEDTDAVWVDVVYDAAFPHGEPLLANGEFEDGLSGWRVTRGNGDAQAGDVFYGGYSLELTPLESPAGYDLVEQTIPLSPNGSYTFSAWVKTIDMVGDAFVRYRFRDEDYEPLCTAELTRHSGTTASDPAHSGTEFHNDFVYETHDPVCSIATAHYVTVEAVTALGAGAPGSAYFDHVRVLDDNLLANGGFEVRAPNGPLGAPPGWSPERGGVVRAGPGNRRAGERGLVFEGETPGITFHQYRQTIAVEPNTDYQITAWIKTVGIDPAPGETDGVQILYKFDDGSMTEFGPLFNGTTVDPLPAGAVNAGLDGHDFVLQQGTVSSSSGSSTLTLWLKREGNGAGHAVIDDVSIFEQ